MVVDIGEVKRHIKPKADSTLRNMRKDELIEYIRCLENNYNVAVSFNENQAKYIESLGALPVWIPVTERLPEIYSPVLIKYLSAQDRTASPDFVDTAVMMPGDIWYWWEGDVGDCDISVSCIITHWMPLPEPPKEEDHEPET